VDALVWALTELFPEITAPAESPREERTASGTGGWMA
jgi:hypothetical protein